MEWDPRGLRAGPELGAGCWAKGLRRSGGTRDVGWRGAPGAHCPAAGRKRAGGAEARCPWGCRGRRGGDRGRRTALPAAHLGLGPVLQEVLQVEVGERRPHAAGAGAAPRLEGHPAAPPPLHRRRQQLQPVPLAPTQRPGPGSAPRPRRRLQLRRGLDRTLRPCGREGRRAGGRCGAGRSRGRAGGGSAGSAAARCRVPAGPPVVSVSVPSSRRLAMPGGSSRSGRMGHGVSAPPLPLKSRLPAPGGVYPRETLSHRVSAGNSRWQQPLALPAPGRAQAAAELAAREGADKSGC